MPKARIRRISVEEQGQRTMRSTDTYQTKGEVKEAAVCTGCHAIHWNKRWYVEGDPAALELHGHVTGKVLCPACQRMQDNNPAGIVTFTGTYLLEHEEDILNTIKNTEEKARMKNPLARIMEIAQEKDRLTVTTTEDKLAQKLGRDVYKSHRGALEYQWSQDDHFVRVNWMRQ